MPRKPQAPFAPVPPAEGADAVVPARKTRGKAAAKAPSAADKAAETEARRIKRAVAVGNVVAPLLEPALAKKGMALARILPHWHALCPLLANYSYPESLRGDVLTIAVASDAVKQELIYMAPQVIESANMLLGYTAVAKVRAITKTLETKPQRQVTRPLQPSAEARDRAAAMCKHVKDDALRQALAALGATFQRKNKT